MYFWLELLCVYLFVLKIGHLYGLPEPAWQRKRRVISLSHKEPHIAFLQHLDTWIRVIVAVAVTVAIELTINWNAIQAANTLSGAGNTIPFIIGVGAVIRVLYVAASYDDEDSSDGDSYYSYEYSPRPSGGPPDPIPVRQLPARNRIRTDPIPMRQMPVMEQQSRPQ